MKRTSKAIREERAAKYDALDALAKKARGENRNFTQEEVTEMEKLEGDIQSLSEELRAVEAQERAEAIMAARAAGNPVNRGFSEKEEKDLKEYSLRKVLLSAGDRHSQLDGVEKEMHQEAEREMREFGKSVQNGAVAIPSFMMDRMYSKRDISVGTGGGDKVIETLVLGYVEALRERSLALQLGAEYLSGLTGNFKIARENAVYAPTFKIGNADADESNPTLADAEFNPKRLTGLIDVDKQLLIQSSVAIEARLRNQLLQGHAEKLDQIAWNGAGTGGEPTGILNDADVPVTAIGTNGGAITKVLIEQLTQAIEEQKGMTDSTAFVTSPIIKRILKAVSYDSGSGQFMWAKDNTVDGIRAFVTTHVPKNLSKGTGTNLSAIILGDLRNAMFGQWGGTEILVDPYSQGLKGLIRYIPTQYVDFHVIQPGRFRMIKDITTS